MDYAWKRSLCLTAVGVTVIATIVAIVFGVVLQPGVWADYEGEDLCDTICENSHQCNHTMAERPVVQQPINAWSNLGYLVAGFLVLTDPGRKVDIATSLFFLVTLYILLCCFIAHASMTLFWHEMAYAALYAGLWTMSGHAIHAVYGVPYRWIAITVGLGSVLFAIAIHTDGLLLFLLFSVMLIVIVTIITMPIILVVSKVRTIRKSNTMDRHQKRKDIARVIAWATMPFLVFGAGYVCWLLGDHVWCNPTHFIQGHSLWHLLSAASSYLAWQYFDKNPRWANSQSVDNINGEAADGGDEEDVVVVSDAVAVDTKSINSIPTKVDARHENEDEEPTTTGDSQDMFPRAYRSISC